MYSRQLIRVAAVLIALLRGLSLASGYAQLIDEVETRAEYPLMVLNCAGVERWFSKAEVLFTEADRLETLELIDRWVRETLHDLPGMDRSKPFGMMFYLRGGLTPGIEAIAYFPVTDANAFITYLAGKEGTLIPVSGKKNYYEIEDSERMNDVFVRVLETYVFVTPKDETVGARALERSFPDLQRLLRRITDKYDLSYSILLKNIPLGYKSLFMEAFKNQALANLQQRDHEPDAAYRLRRAHGENVVDFLDKIIQQGQELTLGLFVDDQNRRGLIEVELSGSKDSTLAKMFQDMAGRRTYFAPLVDTPATLTVSLSWQLDQKQRRILTELFNILPEELPREIEKGGFSATQAKEALYPICNTLLNTAEQGHLDFFFQIAGDQPQAYSMLLAVRVLGNDQFPKHVEQLLEFVQSTNRIPGLQLRDAKVREHLVHKIPVPAPSDDVGRAMFGEQTAVLVMASPQTLWFVFGGSAAHEQLQQYVEQIESRLTLDTTPQRNPPPFQVVTHARRWVNAVLMSEEASPALSETQPPRPAVTPFPQELDTSRENRSGDRQRRNRSQRVLPSATRFGQRSFHAAQTAFQEDNDEMRLIGRPTETGTRLQFQFQAGYLGWLGQMLASGIENNAAAFRVAP